MTYDQYRQLKTYAWYDGIYLAVLWTASFAFLICASAFPPFSLACNLIALSTPFFVGYRLRKFRNEGLDGTITFGRALSYCFRVFMNAAIIFSLVQWAYMQFVDNGHLADMLMSIMSQPEYADVLKLYNLSEGEMRQTMESITPTQFALTYFITNIFAGIVLSLIIAVIMKRKV